jgi:broad specificity phosphatase PhoE
MTSLSSVEQIKQPENKEEILLRVFVTRHGPKLYAAGEKNLLAAYFNDSVKEGFRKMDIEEGSGLVHVNASPVTRAMETAEAIKQELETGEHRLSEASKEHPRKGAIRSVSALEVPFQPAEEASEEKYSQDFETLVKMQAALEPSIRAELEKEFPGRNTQEQEAEIRNRIDMAVLAEMFSEAKKPTAERKFQSSYEELADRFAQRYFGFASHLNILKEKREQGGQQPADEPYLQIDISHSFPITSFLKKYLVFEDGQRAEDLDPHAFFEKTGGIIREAGSLRLDYIQAEQPLIKVEAEFSPGKKFTGFIKSL